MRINLTKKDLVNLVYMQLGFSKQIRYFSRPISMKICRNFANFSEFLYPVTQNSGESQISTDSGYGSCQKSSNNFGEIPDFRIWGVPGGLQPFQGASGHGGEAVHGGGLRLHRGPRQAPRVRLRLRRHQGPLRAARLLDGLRLDARRAGPVRQGTPARATTRRRAASGARGMLARSESREGAMRDVR